MKRVTLEISTNQAEALFCLLRLAIDEHYVYNNNDGLTYRKRVSDIDAIDSARRLAAKRLYKQLTPAARKRHGHDIK